MTNSKKIALKDLVVQDEVQAFRELNWVGTFEDYLNKVRANPLILRNAFQRMFDMLVYFGKTDVKRGKNKTVAVYKFFEDVAGSGEDAVFGIEESLEVLVRIFESAAQSHGPEHRILLLHGPVGSSKSTIARLLKRGLEHYSRIPEGEMYTFSWDIPAGILNTVPLGFFEGSPMNEEPLYLLPTAVRDRFLAQVPVGSYPLLLPGNLSPSSRFLFNELQAYYNGDLEKVISHVAVKRLTLSESDRRGIGTFQPKDEKNQDSTELSGEMNFRKVAIYGSDAHPLAFNFDGEFQVGNRGMVEFIEALKLDTAFLYDLLGASQEHSIKPKKFSQTYIDEVIIAHTNEPEYKKLQNNQFMEALRDRTIKIDVPYITKLSDEIKIYEKYYNNRSLAKHVAPHTLEVAAMWAVLSRLEEPKKARLTLIQKMKLYDGKNIPGWNENSIEELRDDAVNEGMFGISPRYIQDKIANALVSPRTYVNPFMVLNELDDGLKSHSLISSEETRKQYADLINLVKAEYEDIVKSEVQRAIAADEEAVERLAKNYLDNVDAYTANEKIQDPFTNQEIPPNEELMRSIEEKIEIPDSRKDDFRREIMNYMGRTANRGEVFDFRSNARLYKALQLKLFEDQKDSIKLSSLVSKTVDPETQAKIDVVKARLVKDFGYNDESATDVLQFVSGILARGDIQEEKK